MSKERINVTVDPDVKRQVRERNDINVSGAVNEYLKRRLMGEQEDDAVLQIEIERHEEQAQKLEDEAQRHRQKAETKRRELKERQEKRREKLQTAIEQVAVEELSSGLFVTTPDDQLKSLASDAGVTPDELRNAAIEAHEVDG